MKKNARTQNYAEEKHKIMHRKKTNLCHDTLDDTVED
jgi:hypothetical protein